ncbi:MAG: (2Fe-2S)-binding protein [Armatimonadota bacterium]
MSDVPAVEAPASPAGGEARVTVRLTVNGEPRQAQVDPRMLLVFLVREIFELTGTRFGCLTGHCGACTVLLNGRAVKSCTVLAASADGDRVQTIEGLAADGSLHPIQQAFWDQFGFQCGFCTPGMIMTTLELLADTPNPTQEGIKAGISGNLCRCTGYQSIVGAIGAAARALNAAAASTGEIRREDAAR